MQQREVTELLVAWREGDERALDQLMPLVYEELRRLASGYMKSERPDHTLRTTALVHEAYLRLVDTDVPWQDRIHFFAIAATVMRRILVDHARGKRRAKRGGGATPITLDEALLVTDDPAADVLALDEALTRLEAIDERKARAVELHYFSGLTYDELAGALGVSAATVDRDLRFARAWLRREMSS